jgi:hypothetical protein
MLDTWLDGTPGTLPETRQPPDRSLADQQRLHHRQLADVQGDDLQNVADHVDGDRSQPQAPPAEVQQQPGRQRAAFGNPLGAALLQNRRQADGAGVPGTWAKRLTRCSSIIQRAACTSPQERPRSFRTAGSQPLRR